MIHVSRVGGRQKKGRQFNQVWFVLDRKPTDTWASVAHK